MKSRDAHVSQQASPKLQEGAGAQRSPWAEGRPPVLTRLPRLSHTSF